MKKYFPFLLAFLLCPYLAHAQDFTIGTQKFSYSVPEGYIELRRGKNEHEDWLFNSLESVISQQQGVLVTIMVDKNTYPLLQNGFYIQEYAAIFRYPLLDEHSHYPETLKILRDYFIQNNFVEGLKKKPIDATLSLKNEQVVSASVGPGTKPQLLDETDNSFTILMSLAVSVEALQQEIMTLALLKMISIEDKILSVTFYRPHNQPSDIDTIKTDAAAFFADFTIKSEGGTANANNLSPQPRDIATSIAITGKILCILAALTILLIALAFFLSRQQRKKGRTE